MKIFRYIILSISLLAMFSCNFLDVESEDIMLADKYYNTKEDLYTALLGVYATLADGPLYGNNILGRLALEGDEGYESYSVDAQTVGYYVVSAADNKILTYWRSLYEGINRANLLLENIDKPEVESTLRDDIKGQALFLRAYYYYMLVTKFGDVPLILKFADTSKPEDIQIPRTPMDVVYNKIIEDMEEAAGLVSDASAYTGGGRVSKSAVWGVLARVYLKMAGEPLNDTSKYEDAAKWAKKVIDTGFHTLNPSYEQVFVNYIQDLYDIKESIWEVEFYGNGMGSITGVSGMVGRNNGVFNNSTTDDIGYSAGMLRATSVLMDLYKTEDLRKDWNISPYYYRRNADNIEITDTIYWSPNGNKFQRYCGKYRRDREILLPKSTTATPINFPLLRYSDVLLMYAEAVNKKGNASAEEITMAYEAVNMVKRRGYGFDVQTANAGVDINQTNTPVGEDFHQHIMDERARELCFEALRKDDLVRWGVFYNRMKAVLPEIPPGTSSYLVAAQTIYGNVTKRDVIWPIPTYELGVNRNLTQNHGW